jgi:hypothetical protein
MTTPATSGSLTPQNSQSDIQPEYTFEIERRPGQGYTVTASHGTRADQWKETALKLLDDIGQPDPKEPQRHRCVPHAGYCVHVSVQLQPDGTAQIRQEWFRRIPSAAYSGSWRRAAKALLLCFLLGVGAGALAGYSLGKQSPPPSTTAQQQEKKGEQPPPSPRRDETLKTLRDSLVRNQEMLQALKQFLAQEGLAAPKEGVSERKRSIQVLVDLDPPRPPGIRESLLLDNQQVRQLLDLLQDLLDAPQKLEKLNNPGNTKPQSSGSEKW